MAKLKKTTIRLRDDHVWTAHPGYKVFVADRGALRFDIPQRWVMRADEDSIKFWNKPPPKDDCILQASLKHLNPQFDWSGIQLLPMFKAATAKDDAAELSRTDPIILRHHGLEAIWHEVRRIDPGEQREAISRMCVAMAGTIYAIISLDFWPEHETRFDPVWQVVLESLRMGQYIADPRTGRQVGYG